MTRTWASLKEQPSGRDGRGNARFLPLWTSCLAKSGRSKRQLDLAGARWSSERRDDNIIISLLLQSPLTDDDDDDDDARLARSEKRVASNE